MRKRVFASIAMVLSLGLMAGFASTAVASPNLGQCGSCHTKSTSVTVKATQTANNGSSATFKVSVSGPGSANGWAVYAGSTRKTYGSGGSGTFTVADGVTYTVYGGNVGSSKLYNTTSISPAAVATSGTPNTTATASTDTSATTSYRRHFNLHHHRYNHLKAVLTNKATGKKYYAAINRRGNAYFRSVPVGHYRLSTTGNRHYKFRSRSVNIQIHLENEDD